MTTASLDCREFEALRRRNFRPYSRGHQIMYDAPLKLMERSARSPQRFAILEAGFGIGHGLDRMIEDDVIASYLGFEPDKESFDYVLQRHGKRENVQLRHGPFQSAAGFTPIYDHVFCIEVIEHVPPERHQGFLTDLRGATKGTLWLSTPDKAKSDHGVRTAAEWLRFIHAAGFNNVTVHADQWTTLYACQ